MSINRGKQFENVFKSCWIKSFPDSFILRLPDQQSGYFGTSRNICDFICFESNILFLLECKSIKGNTFPLSNLKQYDKLVHIKNIHNLRKGVIIWFYEHNRIVYVPIKTISQLIKDNKKSVNIKYLDEKMYYMLEIPSTLKRTFMDSDYKVLLNLKDGE